MSVTNDKPRSTTAGIPAGKWLYLPAENQVRELDSKLLLACCAAERGYNAVIAKHTVFNEIARFLPSGYIIEKCISIYKRDAIQRRVQAGHRLSAHDEESLSAYCVPWRYLEERLSEDMFGMVDWLFTWGIQQNEVIAQRYGAHLEQCLVTGSPRMDVCRPEFKVLYEAEAARIRGRFGPYILFPSNFSGVIHGRGYMYYLSDAAKAGVPDVGDTRARVEALLQHREKNLQLFVEALPRIAARFPEHTLIVRPHPADDVTFWRRAVEGVPNCRIVLEGTATPWLVGADAIFHNGCTTGLEAFLLGKAAIAYHPDYDPRYDIQMSTRVGPKVETEADLVSAIERSVAAGGEAWQPGAWLEDYIAGLSGDLASSRMLDHLDGVDLPESGLDLGGGNLRFQKFRLMRTGYRARKKLRNMRRSVSGAAGRPEPKWPRLRSDVLTARMAELGRATGRFGAVEVVEIYRNCFVLYTPRKVARE